MSDLGIFATTLAETIDWCAEHASADNPAGSLRSPELRPRSGPVLEASETAIHHVIGARSGLLQARRPISASGLSGGRLLVYEPDMNLADGAAQNSTDGFFDEENIPPWDTWLGYVHGRVTAGPDAHAQRDEPTTGLWCAGGPPLYLVSWVPPQLLDLVSNGVWANPEQCIRWAVDVEHVFFRRLLSAGLLA